MNSMEPEAEQKCESLLNLALQADSQNVEVLQCLASVRMSQQRPEEARTYVQQSWSSWKEYPLGKHSEIPSPMILTRLHVDNPSVPTIPIRLALARLMLELLMYKEALMVISGVIETDDQEVEAWYLEGWCFLLMSEDAKEKNAQVEGLGWLDLAQDARDCLETCISVRLSSDYLPIS
jgi:hypothetical protein